METANTSVTKTEVTEIKPTEIEPKNLIESLWDWNIAAGRVITGLLKPLRQPQKQRNEIEDAVYTPPHFSAATRNDALVRKYLDYNKSVNIKWKPRYPFWWALLKAHQKDQQWTAAAKAKVSVRWGVNNAFMVEVERRGTGKGSNGSSKISGNKKNQEQWAARPWTRQWYREIDQEMINLDETSELQQGE